MNNSDNKPSSMSIPGYSAAIDALDWGGDTALVIGHRTPDTDSICSAVAYAGLMRAMGHDCVAKAAGNVNRETKFIAGLWDLPLPEVVHSVAPGTRLILMDHSEYAQAVEGAGQARLLQVIDHHGVGDIRETNLMLYKAMPVGSTCTIVYHSFLEFGISISDETARVLLAGIISDTRNLAKGTTTAMDVAVRSDLAARLGMTDEYLSTVFAGMDRAAHDISGMSDREIFLANYKRYRIEGLAIGIASIDGDPSVPAEEFLDRMLRIMPETMDGQGEDMIFAKVDIGRGTYILYYDPSGRAHDIAEKAFGQSVRPGICHSARNLSRKTAVVPMISRALK